MNQYDLITGTGYWHRRGNTITLDDPFAADLHQTETGWSAERIEQEGPIELAVHSAISAGNRDENSLTNLVFFARHPERGRRPLARTEPGFSTLSIEWRDIRNKVVRPMLRKTAHAGTSSSIPSGSKGPLPLVSTPIPASGPGFTTSGTRVKYGIPETIDALMWIGAKWGRRHPDVTFMVRDISRLGGGEQAPHKSHRIGLDADVQLLKDGKKMDVTGRDYAAFRPYVQDLVNIIESNPVLPVKAIGILDPVLKGRTVQQWDGHVRHLHVRFCMPLSRRADLDTKKVGGTSASYYRCASSEQEFEGILDEAEMEHAWEGGRY